MIVIAAIISKNKAQTKKNVTIYPYDNPCREFDIPIEPEWWHYWPPFNWLFRPIEPIIRGCIDTKRTFDHIYYNPKRKLYCIDIASVGQFSNLNRMELWEVVNTQYGTGFQEERRQARRIVRIIEENHNQFIEQHGTGLMKHISITSTKSVQPLNGTENDTPS